MGKFSFRHCNLTVCIELRDQQRSTKLWLVGALLRDPKATRPALIFAFSSNPCVKMIRLLLFTAALCGTVILIEWIAVEKDVYIPWDLGETPLQIKTDYKWGSGYNNKIAVEMYDIGGSLIGGVKVLFSVPFMKYQINSCNDFTKLSEQPPVEVEKIWKITKSETAIIITCNNVEVLNYLFADSSNTKCVTKWGSDVVKQIKFEYTDTESDFYRAGPQCPAFIVDKSTQGSWAASTIGTTATIECVATHSLVGSATLYCQDEGSWSSDLLKKYCAAEIYPGIYFFSSQTYKLKSKFDHPLLSTSVERDVEIPWDLDGTPLQIKTESTLGSGEAIWVWMYVRSSSWIIGWVDVKFSSTMQYQIDNCATSYTDLPVQPPVEVEKIWTIRKTETALIITCNNVEVLKYLFADSSNNNCVPRWGGNVAEQIKFDKNDTASDFYKAVLNLKYCTARMRMSGYGKIPADSSRCEMRRYLTFE
eukprot:sb/3464325/